MNTKIIARVNGVDILSTSDEQFVAIRPICEALGIDPEGQRQRILHLDNKFTMIDDTYNASPDSMKASINVLCDMPCAGKRVAVLGDMFELGENEVLYHKEIGQFLLDKNVDEVILLGELSQNIKQVLEQSDSKIKVYSFSDNEEAAIYLVATLRPEDVVLLKASNGMNLKEIVNILLSE